MNNLDAALMWYQRSLTLGPLKPSIIAAIAFTQHLLCNFDEAIVLYHQALSIEPKFNFCSEMLTNAMNDVLTFVPRTEIS
jgi:tetratricopeptide (TPR) repeat protein